MRKTKKMLAVLLAASILSVMAPAAVAELEACGSNPDDITLEEGECGDEDAWGEVKETDSGQCYNTKVEYVELLDSFQC